MGPGVKGGAGQQLRWFTTGLGVTVGSQQGRVAAGMVHYVARGYGWGVVTAWVAHYRNRGKELGGAVARGVYYKAGGKECTKGEMSVVH